MLLTAGDLQLRLRPPTQEGADVLRDASGLAGGHLALPQTVQQGGFPMVHVAHDGDHRRAWHQ